MVDAVGTMVSEEEAGIFCDFGMIRTRVNGFRSWGGVGDNTWRHKHKRKEIVSRTPFSFHWYLLLFYRLFMVHATCISVWFSHLVQTLQNILSTIYK